ncbi:hypothetical protein I316_01476 [Kwoniella heveanensis BCC8398]|uniref:Uncharacterized protein n=1 Tax=Kwoniella heveanensis BCC8398 TaxID=1296120 RepID=A0A1B9H0T6_9TREE|nr:hypothetical protein I316_01476 [Kwoniella heveanensis BCC8398]
MQRGLAGLICLATAASVVYWVVLIRRLISSQALQIYAVILGLLWAFVKDVSHQIQEEVSRLEREGALSNGAQGVPRRTLRLARGFVFFHPVAILATLSVPGEQAEQGSTLVTQAFIDHVSTSITALVEANQNAEHTLQTMQGTISKIEVSNNDILVWFQDIGAKLKIAFA